MASREACREFDEKSPTLFESMCKDQTAPKLKTLFGADSVFLCIEAHSGKGLRVYQCVGCYFEEMQRDLTKRQE